MKHIYKIIFLFLCFPFFTSAQVNYQEGVIVKNNGETIKGYIDYREWSFTPQSIDFKTNLTDKNPVSYSPADLHSFEVVNKDNYISYSGTLTMDKNVFPDLPTQLDTATSQGSVFLRVVYNGTPLSLLEQRDDIKSRFFIMEKDNKPIELIYHEYYTANKFSSKPVVTYKQKLLELSARYNPGNTKIESQINYIKFVGPDIRNVLRAINSDNSVTKSTGNSSRFFIGVAGYNSSTKFEGVVSTTNYTKSNYTLTAISPQVNIGIDAFLNKNIQRLIFRGELSFSTSSFSKSSDDPADPAVFGFPANFNSTNVHSSYQLNQFAITLSPQLIYNFTNSNSVKVFAGTGINLTYSIFTNNTFSYGTSNYPNYFKLNKNLFSIPVNAGVVISKKIEIAVNYTTPVDFSNNAASTNTIKNTRYGLSLAYFFY